MKRLSPGPGVGSSRPSDQRRGTTGPASRRSGPLRALAFLTLLLPGAVHAQVPPDFSLTGIAGGRAPWEDVTKVTLDAAGHGNYYVMAAGTRSSGVFVLTASFTLTNSQMSSLWSSIQSNTFFTLAPLFDSGARDGSYCSLFVLGNARQNRVVAKNSAVPRLDNIVILLNSLTPGASDLIYNAILPGPGLFAVESRTPPGILTGKGTTVTRGAHDCEIIVTIEIDITGTLATQAVATAYKNDIEEKWNRPAYKAGSWCPVKFVVNTHVGNTKNGHHQIAVVASTSRSFVNTPLPAINGNGGSGSWRSNAGDDNGSAHEAGHLMGLDDQYDDDPDGGSTPRPGHEHDIMATKDKSTDPPASAQTTDIQSIIDAGGVTCPEFCCVWDPVPIPPGYCSVGGSTTQTVTGTNRNQPSGMQILNATCSLPSFHVSPTSAFIPMNGSFPFHLTFTPSTPGPQSALLIFTRQGQTGTVRDTLAVSGFATTPSLPALPPYGLWTLAGGLGLLALRRVRRRA
jgi:hypothetical protein